MNSVYRKSIGTKELVIDFEDVFRAAETDLGDNYKKYIFCNLEFLEEYLYTDKDYAPYGLSADMIELVDEDIEDELRDAYWEFLEKEKGLVEWANEDTE